MNQSTNPHPAPFQMGWGRPLSVSTRQCWEYLSLRTAPGGNPFHEVIVAINGDGAAPLVREGLTVSQALATLGVQEWELVAVCPAGSDLVYTFKRTQWGDGHD